MARQRKATSTTVEATEATDTASTADNGNTTTQGERKQMAGLTAEQIAALLSSSRSKGQYLTYLNQFVESGEGGVCVNEQWVDLKDKKSSTLKQGFENAKENKGSVEGAENVKVLVNNEQVFLINLAAAGIEVPEAA